MECEVKGEELGDLGRAQTMKDSDNSIKFLLHPEGTGIEELSLEK